MIEEQIKPWLNEPVLIRIDQSKIGEYAVPAAEQISGIPLRIRDGKLVLDRCVQAEHRDSGEFLGIHWEPIEVLLDCIEAFEPADGRIITIKVRDEVDIVRYFQTN